MQDQCECVDTHWYCIQVIDRLQTDPVSLVLWGLQVYTVLSAAIALQFWNCRSVVTVSDRLVPQCGVQACGFSFVLVLGLGGLQLHWTFSATVQTLPTERQLQTRVLSGCPLLPLLTRVTFRAADGTAASTEGGRQPPTRVQGICGSHTQYYKPSIKLNNQFLIIDSFPSCFVKIYAHCWMVSV